MPDISTHDQATAAAPAAPQTQSTLPPTPSAPSVQQPQQPPPPEHVGDSTPPTAASRPSGPRKRRGGARASGRPGKPAARGPQQAAKPPHPLLEVLAERFPKVFGNQPLPLKRGVFDELVAVLPELDVETLKQALALHTRSNRYLQAVANAQPRHDLQAQVVEPMAPEHSFHALTELYRRRLRRAQRDAATQPSAPQEEAGTWFERRLTQAIQQSGLAPAAYAEAVTTRDKAIQAMLARVVEQLASAAAREEAMLAAFEASGSSVAEFAEMYGLTGQEAGLMLARAKLHRSETASNSNR